VFRIRLTDSRAANCHECVCAGVYRAATVRESVPNDFFSSPLVFRIRLAVIALGCAAIGAVQAGAVPTDILIVNGKVYTADGGAFEEAVAIRGNGILRVGATQEILGLRGPANNLIDAQGGAVLPGFNDIHIFCKPA